MIAVPCLYKHTTRTESISCLKIFSLNFAIKRHLSKELESELEARFTPAAVLTKHIGSGRWQMWGFAGSLWASSSNPSAGCCRELISSEVTPSDICISWFLKQDLWIFWPSHLNISDTILRLECSILYPWQFEIPKAVCFPKSNAHSLKKKF